VVVSGRKRSLMRRAIIGVEVKHQTMSPALTAEHRPFTVHRSIAFPGDQSGKRELS
jgi:hypothetical protein